MNWKIFAVCLLLTLSGCTVVDQPGHSNTVSFYGDLNSTGDEFLMDGYLNQVGTNKRTLNNVSVCGYGEDGELLFAEPVPPFEVNQKITIRSDRAPYYIVIYSEEFWETDSLWPSSSGKLDAARYWVSLENGGYTPEWAETEGDLPMDTDRPLENGCPS